jgi:hypothetical protein
VVADRFLQAPQVPRLGLCVQRRELDRAVFAVGDPQPVQAGERVVQRGELAARLLPERGGERGWVQRLAELVVVFGASGFEVGWGAGRRATRASLAADARADEPATRPRPRSGTSTPLAARSGQPRTAECPAWPAPRTRRLLASPGGGVQPGT